MIYKRTDARMTSSLTIFSLCFSNMTENCEDQEDILPDWVNEDVQKRLAEAVDNLQLDSMLPCVCSLMLRSQRTSKCGKNISGTLGYRLVCHFFVLTTF